MNQNEKDSAEFDVAVSAILCVVMAFSFVFNLEGEQYTKAVFCAVLFAVGALWFTLRILQLRGGNDEK